MTAWRRLGRKAATVRAGAPPVEAAVPHPNPLPKGEGEVFVAVCAGAIALPVDQEQAAPYSDPLAEGEGEVFVAVRAVAVPPPLGWEPAVPHPDPLPAGAGGIAPAPALQAAGVILTPEQQGRLLAIARRAVRETVTGRPDPAAPIPDQDLPLGGGVFVTLLKRGKLRGCVGRISSAQPLAQTVREMAACASRDDHRFPPVAAAELGALTLEISVLSATQPLQGAEQVRPGVDGLIVTLGLRRGLLLPQVAAEHGWDAETFLAQTCFKAGLQEDAWKLPDILLERFQALVFSELTAARSRRRSELRPTN